MKYTDDGPTRAATAGAPSSPGGDVRTREAVTRVLLERGPVSAADIAGSLGIGVAAVRRHLDTMRVAGQVDGRAAPRRGPRGRGRPAQLFVLTAAGRVGFGHAYDDLAVAALRFLVERDGPDAVREFASRRVHDMVDHDRDRVLDAPDPATRAAALADALTAQGYAASAQQVGTGVQLCQHHCPVAHVAAEFPQLCEAETEAFAELLGSHVQRLATIARGDAVCTTHLPPDRGQARPGLTEPTTTPDGGTAT